MTRDDRSEDAIKRQFDQSISGLSAGDLHGLLGDLLSSSRFTMSRPDPPELRRPALSEPAVLTVRIDLQHAKPPIWRRLEVRSDLTLADVHQIIQTAFGWADAHLYRFALGGNPFDRRSQVFLCPFDVEEGEEAGTPMDEVRLDETLQEPGDRLDYVYDYGDDWHHVLKVEAVRPVGQDAPRVVVTGGRRAAPPEDCGGLTDAEDLAAVLEDPACFDLDVLNEALAADEFTLSELGLPGCTGRGTAPRAVVPRACR